MQFPATSYLRWTHFIARTLRDQPLRLLLIFFFHFNRSEPTYKSQCIKLLGVIAACNELNVNALKMGGGGGRFRRLYIIEGKFMTAGN